MCGLRFELVYIKQTNKMNVGKCEVMVFVFETPEKLEMQEKSLEYKTFCKYLSVNVDKWLRFN